MNRDILVQALQSEGVVDEVIVKAVVKAEMYGLEERLTGSIYRTLGQVADRGYNVFARTQSSEPYAVKVRKVVR